MTLKRLLILSDTHLPNRAKELPTIIQEELKNIDGIIHAGDFSHVKTYHDLSSYSPIYAVYGNCDDHDLTRMLPKKLTIEIEEVKIGITHGDGFKKTTQRRVYELFEQDELDVIIFGHSHIPLKEMTENKLMFNPGSPTDKRKQKEYSYGILEINKDQFTINHHFFL